MIDDNDHSYVDNDGDVNGMIMMIFDQLRQTFFWHLTLLLSVHHQQESENEIPDDRPLKKKVIFKREAHLYIE